jgi:hypothetical protein
MCPAVLLSSPRPAGARRRNPQRPRLAITTKTSTHASQNNLQVLQDRRLPLYKQLTPTRILWISLERPAARQNLNALPSHRSRREESIRCGEILRLRHPRQAPSVGYQLQGGLSTVQPMFLHPTRISSFPHEAVPRRLPAWSLEALTLQGGCDPQWQRPSNHDIFSERNPPFPYIDFDSS